MRATSALPLCPGCGALARPNILMFDDWQWDSARSVQQFNAYQAWLRSVAGKRVVAIELGAGTAIPTVRRECQRRADVLIRINPHDAKAPAGGISLRSGALEALSRMAAMLED